MLARQADRPVGEIVDETRLDGPQVGRHGLQLLGRIAIVPVPLSNSTVPCGLKSSAFWVVPSRLPLTSIVLPDLHCQDTRTVDGQAALEVERGAGLDAQIALIEQRPDLDGGRASADRETQSW